MKNAMKKIKETLIYKLDMERQLNDELLDALKEAEKYMFVEFDVDGEIATKTLNIIQQAIKKAEK